jgi:hypothetical protein
LLVVLEQLHQVIHSPQQTLCWLLAPQSIQILISIVSLWVLQLGHLYLFLTSFFNLKVCLFSTKTSVVDFSLRILILLFKRVSFFAKSPRYVICLISSPLNLSSFHFITPLINSLASINKYG